MYFYHHWLTIRHQCSWLQYCNFAYSWIPNRRFTDCLFAIVFVSTGAVSWSRVHFNFESTIWQASMVKSIFCLLVISTFRLLAYVFFGTNPNGSPHDARLSAKVFIENMPHWEKAITLTRANAKETLEETGYISREEIGLVSERRSEIQLHQFQSRRPTSVPFI